MTMKHFDDSELEALLDDLESDRVERKESFKGDKIQESVCQAICAFSNDFPNHNAPGILFIGAKNDGSSSGLTVTDKLLCNIGAIRSDGNILPIPAMTVRKCNLKGSDMAVVIVQPSDLPPVRYKGCSWIRVGPRRAIASVQEERILNEKRRSKHTPFDINRVPPSQLDTLSRFNFINEYLPRFLDGAIPQDELPYEESLATCRMIHAPDDPTPTVLGLLIIGISPQDFLPGAEIQFLRINGIELTDDVVDEALLRGNITEQLRGLREKLLAHNRTAVDILAGPTHRLETLYPIAAIDQIVYNAVLHRNYEGTNTPVRVYWFDDRIEISSPGGPYGTVTCENFGKPGITDYRNPNLATAMKALGFIQGFGRGIATAQKLMEQNGNPPPEFQINAHNVLCILRKHV